MTWLADWWHCRRRLVCLDNKLKAAGLHHRDPVYALIREMALLPDRLLRCLALEVLILSCVAVGVLFLMLAIRKSDEFQVYRGATSNSRIVVIDSAGGMRWVNCLPDRSCLEVFLEKQGSQ